MGVNRLDKIIEELGRGGMGIVYLAEDTKLKRKTTLKFLPSNALIQEEDKTRFVQEVQAFRFLKSFL